MRYLQRGLTHHDTKRATPGFTLYTPLRNATAYLVNMAGEIVHQWDLPAGPSNDGYLLPNGSLLIALRSDDSPHEMARGGIMRELDWDGNIVSEYIDPYQHHDFRRCANGNLMYLGWQLLPEDHVARVQGGIPGSEHAMGIWGDYIREVNPAGETVWQWNGWEHMEIKQYPLPPTANRHEFAHPNTIVALADGNALICFRHVIGSIRRDVLDHVIVLHERHLHRLLMKYMAYYHRFRTHLSLEMDCPTPRAVHPPELGKILAVRELHGLHHHYERQQAA